VRKYINKARSLAFSGTARDTYLLFFNGTVTAFLGFVFTWFVARALSVSDFGVFSAISNLVFIIAPVTDFGISSAIIKFVASLEAEGKGMKAKEYVKAGFLFKFAFLALVSILLIIFAPFVSRRLLATDNSVFSYWVIFVSLGLFLSSYISPVLQAYKRFVGSVTIDISYSLTRVVLIFLFGLSGLTLFKSLGAFAFAGVVPLIIIAFIYGYGFLKTRPTAKIYKELLGFSGWLGVNRVLSSVSGRADVQMLAALSGAIVTGYYSIASRLALFIVVLASSFGAVISPRLAAFNNKEKEKVFILKSTLALVAVSFGIILWIIIARPFITVLFGVKYLESVNVFKALALSMIPFLFTAPSVSAIIYSIKKPKYIGMFSIFQTVLIIALNYFLIPKFGAFGPTITFGVVNTLLLIYSWVIVYRYYWGVEMGVKR